MPRIVKTTENILLRNLSREDQQIIAELTKYCRIPAHATAVLYAVRHYQKCSESLQLTANKLFAMEEKYNELLEVVKTLHNAKDAIKLLVSPPPVQKKILPSKKAAMRKPHAKKSTRT